MLLIFGQLIKAQNIDFFLYYCFYNLDLTYKTTISNHHIQRGVGKTERCFDFLGYFLKPYSVAVSAKTVDRCIERIARLYEHGADINRIGQYFLKWLQWVFGGDLAVRIAIKWPASGLSMIPVLTI